MKTTIYAILLVGFFSSAFPSEKGGNTDPSELQRAIGYFAVSSECPSDIDFSGSMRSVCSDLARKFEFRVGNIREKRFFVECCTEGK